MAESCLTAADAEFIALPMNRPDVWETDDLEPAVDGLRLQDELGFRSEPPIDSRGWEGIAAIAADRCGLLFLIDRPGRLWIYDPYQDRAEMIPCLLRFPAPRGLAVSDRALYLAHVHTTGQQRIVALARLNWQTRWCWEDAEGRFGDLAVDACERLFALDQARRVIHVLGADGHHLHTLGGGEFKAPARLALGQDEKLYVLDAHQVVRLERDGSNAYRVPLVFPDAPTMLPAALTADASGTLLIGDGRSLTGEEERVISRFSPTGTPLHALVGYLGPAFQMVWGPHQRLFVVGARDTIIAIVPRTRFHRQGAFRLAPFDAGSPETRWHKLVLESDRPDGTQITLQYRIGTTLETLSGQPWSAPLVNCTDALVEGERGRYLEVRGALATNNTAITPRLRAVIAVLPRRSYLRYLPAVYQEDPVSTAFLERFLSIFETLIGRVDTTIDDTTRLLDPAATPSTFLPWLASWVALSLDAGWSEAQQRRFLAEATQFYKQRGTRQGLCRIVEAIMGQAPLIIESWQFACVQDPVLRHLYAQLYGDDAYHFCVLLEPPAPETAAAVALVRRMVEEQAPAHTRPGVLALRPWFHLGLHTYLGINSRLTEPFIRLGTSVLGGGETALLDYEEAGQIARKARIGQDTLLV